MNASAGSSAVKVWLGLGVPFDERERGVERREGLARRGGNPSPAHDLFRERLGRLDARGGRAGSEDGLARVAQRAREPGGERRFRAYDGEIDPVLAGCRDEVGRRGDGNGEIGPELARAGIAGSGEDSRVGEVALQRPAERVLAAASPDDQDSHFFLLNASVNAWAARFAVSTTSSTTAFASFI